MYLIGSTVKRLPYFNGFQSFSFGFASINDDNINFISLREVIPSSSNFHTVLFVCAYFKCFSLFHNQTPWKDLKYSELPVHVHIYLHFGVQCHGFISRTINLELYTFAMV